MVGKGSTQRPWAGSTSPKVPAGYRKQELGLNSAERRWPAAALSRNTQGTQAMGGSPDCHTRYI